MASYMVNNFMLGELSPRFFGHPDNQIYFHGAARIKNGIVTPQGGVRISPGSYYKRNTHNNLHAKMIPFTVDDEVAYTVLLTNLRMDIIGDGTVTAQTTVWTEAQIDELDFEQFGPALYVVHRSHPVQKIQRASASTWTVTVPTLTPFAATGDYPGTVTSFEGRLIFASTNNDPNKRWGSKPGSPEVFTSATVNPDDPWSAEGPNRILWMVGGAALFMGTPVGVYKIGGKESVTIPENAFVEWKQSGYSVGRNFPVLAGESVYFLQKSGTAIRKILYDMNTESFVAPDITIYSEHLFAAGVKCMAFQNEPNTIFWIVTKNGKLLSMAMDEAGGTYSVTEIDMAGFVEDVSVCHSAKEDLVRVVVQRFIDGALRRHVDELAPFDQGVDIMDSHYVLSGLSWDGGDPVKVTAATQADPLVVTIPDHDFTVGDFIRFREVTGMTPLDGVFYAQTIVGNDITIFHDDGATPVDSTGWPAFTAATSEKVTKILTGLQHLDQEIISGIADGGSFSNISPLGGEVEIPDYGNKIHVGYPYQCVIQPMPIAFAPNKIKRVCKVYVRFLDTAGAFFGESDEHGTQSFEEALPFRRFEDIMGEPVPPTSGLFDAEFDGDYVRNGTVFIKSSGPLPFMVTSIMAEVEVWE